jgi:uncharacterized protein
VFRAVLDPGVLVSVLLAAEGPPGRILDCWRQGEIELVVSDTLLAELEHVLLRPRFASRVDTRDARAYLAGIRRAALVLDDPPAEPGLTRDPDDDYLSALARAANADLIVSGDAHLTELPNAKPPVLTPRAFADLLD